MAKMIEKSAKTVEEALKAAVEELGVSENDVTYEVVEEASRGFLGLIGTKLAKIRVTVKEIDNIPLKSEVPKKIEPVVEKKEVITEQTENIAEKSDIPNKIEIAEKFLKDIFEKMKLDVKIEINEKDDRYIFNLFGENLGILIGKHGQTLDALQYLLNLAANRNENDQRIHFIVDVENYRGRREETLKNLAMNLAERAIRMNQDVRLEPMNRHERKVIHTSLQDNDKVITHSVGEEPYRHIIISPKIYNKDKRI